MGNASNEKVIKLLEEQLTYTKEQNKNLTKQIEALTEQVRRLTKALYGSKSEKSSIRHLSRQKNKAPKRCYTVTRKKTNKKRNDSFREDIEIEEIHEACATF